MRRLTSILLAVIAVAASSTLFAADPGQRFILQAVQLDGSTVLSEEQVARIAGAFVGRTVAMEDLNQLRHLFNQAYLDAGFVNSSVVIPDQDILDGVVRYEAREGVLGDIRFSADTRLGASYLSESLRNGLSEPLKLTELQNSLLMLERHPLIDRIDARLRPGDDPTRAVLDLDVQELPAMQVGLRVDNHRPPSVGAEQATVTFLHQNLTGHGDVFAAALAGGEGDLGGSVSYRLPMPSWRSSLLLFYEANDSEVVTAPFDDIDVESETDTWGVEFTYAPIDTGRNWLNLLFGFQQKHSETFLLDLPFSFSVGAENGESDASIFTVGVEIGGRSETRAYAVRASGRFGVDAFGATSIDGAPDGEFGSLIVQGLFEQRLPFDEGWFADHPMTLRGRFDYQRTDDALQSFEKFSIGGVRTVRGYRETALLKDNAFVASLGVALPLAITDDWDLEMVTYVDHGRGWDELKLSSAPTGEFLSSVGVGFTLRSRWGLDAELFLAKHLNHFEAEGHDLQDDGIHFAITYEYPLSL